MTADLTMDDMRTATTRFYAALGDVLAGDPEPMFAIWSRAGDVCYSGPMGPLVVGWEPIRRSWQEQADAKLGGFVSPEELHFVVGGPLGVVTGYERGEVAADGVATTVNIRATSTYRLDDGEVKMIGHHTDPIGP